jgi:hypothetical protein
MQTMKQVLASFVGKQLDAKFDNGVITLSVKPGATATTGYPRYEIQEVGTDVFRMIRKGSVKAGGVSRYYRIDKGLEIGPVSS